MLVRTCFAVVLFLFGRAEAVEPANLLRIVVERACAANTEERIRAIAKHLPGRGAQARATARVKKLMVGLQGEFEVENGRITVKRVAPAGSLQHISAQYDSRRDDRPVLLALADFRCRIHAARRLAYGIHGTPEWLEHLGRDFEPIGRREPLNPPVPKLHARPGGIPVAVVDTGINYLLPEIHDRLARDRMGQLLGYDYWDLDKRPFDVHPVRSAFAPEHHGTQIASLVLAEAPIARVVPYRYPRPDMSRMGALVQDAAANGIKIINLSLVSYNREEWLPFLRVAERHPEMLFVAAAGNQRHNIDRRPAYPASLPLENLLTVTAARRDGRLGLGVNFGPKSVDIMVPAHDVEVVGFEGEPQRVSGTSYAAARVTAFATCLLARNPDWRAADLKAALLARAAAFKVPKFVAYGFIPDSTLRANGGCGADTLPGSVRPPQSKV